MKQALGNPIAIASLATGAISSGGTILAFLKKHWKIVGGVGAAAFFGYLVYEKYLTGEITIKEDKRFPPSNLEPFDAKVIAENLFKAMNDTSITNLDGVNQDAVYDALDGLTYNDFVKVSDAFGKRYMLFKGKIGLFDWLNAKLSYSDLAELQTKMPNVITTDNTLAIGRDVLANKDGVKVYLGQKVDGIWHRRKFYGTYNKGQKLGEVIYFYKDPWENTTHVFIDKPWSALELNAEAKDLTVV